MRKYTVIFSILGLVLFLWAGCKSSPKSVTTVPTEAEQVIEMRKEPSTTQRFYLEERLDQKRLPSLGVSSSPSKSKESDRLAELSDQLKDFGAGEELWVIYRPEKKTPSSRDEEPGTGMLVTQVDEKKVPLPLNHTDVRASVAAYLATVQVTQEFTNPFDSKIEAVYVFPLPENSAINEFLMIVGDRRIRGVIRERKEAEKIYNQAKRQGYTASLLTQERPNVFTQSVANIEPGKQIHIQIKYYQTLAYDDGWHEFVFPMVVGPRFNPPGSNKGVGAVERHPLASSGQPVDVHYLRPHERSGYDISLQLDLYPGVEIEEFECHSHNILVRGTEQTADWEKSKPRGDNHSKTLSVRLDPRDSIPNKDFVFRYRVEGEQIKSSLLTHSDERGNFFTLMLHPPAGLQNIERAPLELVFVLDCSGSMSGAPLKQAKSAIRYALKNLQRGDSFQLINFSNDSDQLGYKPLEATPKNIERGLRYLDSLQSEGGTMMIEGIKAALDFPHDPERLRFVCFLTDGYVGNESEILREMDSRLGHSRIFSFGVGSSVNRFLLDSMAKVGRGAVAYLGLEDDGAEIMSRFFERISHPALVDVRIDWAEMDVYDVFPKNFPDLFPGRPIIITGKYKGHISSPLHVSGKAGDRRISTPVHGTAHPRSISNEALPSVWARLKIADMLERSFHEPAFRHEKAIRQVALDYQLMSPFTAFVAMDASRTTEGLSGTTVPVAVPVPEGVKYETTVTE